MIKLMHVRNVFKSITTKVIALVIVRNFKNGTDTRLKYTEVTINYIAINTYVLGRLVSHCLPLLSWTSRPSLQSFKEGRRESVKNWSHQTDIHTVLR